MIFRSLGLSYNFTKRFVPAPNRIKLLHQHLLISYLIIFWLPRDVVSEMPFVLQASLRPNTYTVIDSRQRRVGHSSVTGWARVQVPMMALLLRLIS